MNGASREALASARSRLDGLSADDQLLGTAESLFAVSALLGREGGLRRALSDPSMPTGSKTGLLDTLLAGQVDASSLELLHAVVSSRWSEPADLVDGLEILAVAALFIAAEADGALDDIEDELFRFARVVDREPRLRAALTDTSVAADRRVALVSDLLAQRAHPTTIRLVRQIVTEPRGRTLDRALEDYARLAAQQRSRVVARVRSAVPLTEEQSRRLAAALGRIYGHPVDLQVDIDPQVLGGISVRVGDELIDGTVAGRLEAARRGLR